MARQTVGIYWDDIFIHLCVVASSITEFTIERLIKYRREHNEDGTPKRSVSEDIKHLMDEVGLDADTCVVSLSEKDVMYRSVSRPFSDRKKVSATIGPEIETLLPAGEGEVIFDFVVAGRDDTGQTILNVIATHAPPVQMLITELNNAGLDPELIDCPPAAMIAGARNLFELTSDKKYVVLHIGKSDSSIVVLQGDNVRLIDGFPVGFDTITREISRDRVENAFASGEGIEGGAATMELVKEIGLALYRLDRELQGYALILTGYARFVEDLPKYFEDTFAIGVELPTTTDIVFNGSTEDMLDSFMAVSLAFRGVDSRDSTDFRQGDLAFTKKMEEIKGYIGLWTKMFLALFLIWIGGLALDVHLKGVINDNLEAQIRKEFETVMPKGIPIVDPVKQMEQYIRQRSKDIGMGDTQGKDTPLNIIRAISVNIPRDIKVVVDSITIDTNGVILSGKVDSYNNVDKIKAALSKIEYISEVKIVSANVDKADQSVRFKLICKKG
ncbi:MAG: pilus assembly protein PilM [Deltaproteobacteria bacterium]|nr:pilus assembly protein PilM [Deltaproteobacteria bacterium]